jgi:hypothetical protein
VAINAFSVLQTFQDGSDGAFPQSGLIAAGGSLYGRR